MMDGQTYRNGKTNTTLCMLTHYKNQCILPYNKAACSHSQYCNAKHKHQLANKWS